MFDLSQRSRSDPVLSEAEDFVQESTGFVLDEDATEVAQGSRQGRLRPVGWVNRRLEP